MTPGGGSGSITESTTYTAEDDWDGLSQSADRSIAKRKPRQVSRGRELDTLRACVTNHIFPHLKFIRSKGRELQYSTRPNTICYLCFSKMNLLSRMEAYQVWWADVAVKNILRTINRLRSDRAQGLKRAFLRKCILLGWKL